MSATRSRRRRGGAGHEGGEDERWLLTYADMITLLMALFMVLFSISSVNTSKFESLQRALEDAFSGRVLPGGPALMQSGSEAATKNRPAAEPPIPSLRPQFGQNEGSTAEALKKEDEDFRKLKARLDDFAAKHGLKGKVATRIARRGLVIRILTDKLLFDSGRATVKPGAAALLDRLALLVGRDMHAIAVEGHTDSVPIATPRYPSNWELSTTRATAVLRWLVSDGVSERRFEASGYAALAPIDSNLTPTGRSRNRRVEIVLLRATATRGGDGGGAPS